MNCAIYDKIGYGYVIENEIKNEIRSIFNGKSTKAIILYNGVFGKYFIIFTNCEDFFLAIMSSSLIKKIPMNLFTDI